MRENTRENEKTFFEKAFSRFRGCIPLGRTQKPYCAETVCFFCLKGVKHYYYYQVLYRDYKKASLRIPRNQPRYHRMSHVLFPNALHLFFRTRCHWLPPIVSRVFQGSHCPLHLFDYRGVVVVVVCALQRLVVSVGGGFRSTHLN